MKQKLSVWFWVSLFLFALLIGAVSAVCYTPLAPYDSERERLISHELP